MVRNLARLDRPRPPGQERHPDAAVVEVPLDAAQVAGGVELEQVMVGLVVRSVVRREHHQRPVVDSQFAEPSEQRAHVPVHPGDHRRLPLVGVRPVLRLVDAVLRHLRPVADGPRGFVVGVRDRQGEVEEEGRVLLFLHPGQRLAHDQVVGVLVALRRPTALEAAIAAGRPLDLVPERHLLQTAPEELRVVVVGVDLVEVAEEGVEALGEGMPFHADFAEAPLAEQAGGVAGGLQHLGDGDVLGAKRLGRSPGIAADMRMPRVLPRHQDAAGRRAHRRPGVEVGEANPLRRHPVQTRRPDDLLTVGPEVSVPQVVGQDEDHVGTIRRRGRGRRHGQHERQDGECRSDSVHEQVPGGGL